MKLKMKYYAILREQAQKNSEEIDTASTDPKSLYVELREHYGFSLETEQIQVAVNDQFVPFNYQLQENDRVVFIPPVAGG